MAYLMVRRHWNDEALPLASMRVSKARAGVLIGLAMGAGVHRPLGAESQHGDVWLEVESKQHDLISDPVVFPIAAAPAMLRTFNMDDDTIAHHALRRRRMRLRAVADAAADDAGGVGPTPYTPIPHSFRSGWAAGPIVETGDLWET